MKSWKKPTPETVEHALSHMRDVERRYFFSRLSNPLWVDELDSRGCFSRPPSAIKTDSGNVSFPGWPELSYLVKMIPEAPERVTGILRKLPPTDNLSVYIEILNAIRAIQDSKLAASLSAKATEAAQLPYRFAAHDFPAVLAHWATLGPESRTAALKLARILISFLPDVRMKEKAERRKADAKDFLTILEPAPKFDQWEYKEILEKGVRALAQVTPIDTAQLLIDTVAEMLQLRSHEMSEDSFSDYSEIWCRRIDTPSHDYTDSKELLIHTLTFSCVCVYEKQPASVAHLDKILRHRPWHVFKRVREHLYSKFPTSETLPWIREAILNHKDFGVWDHHFDFQCMVRSACEHFNEQLLSLEERTAIFEQIISGPPKDHVKESMGDAFDEEFYFKRQQYFHRKQLRPFASVLFGTYKHFYDQLNRDDTAILNDEDYAPYKSEGAKTIETRSPKSPADLASLADDELVAFLNTWRDSHRDTESWWIEINYDGLGNALQQLISDDYPRFSKWGTRWHLVRRPFYFRYVLGAATKYLQSNPQSDPRAWLELSAWVLTHPEKEEGKAEKPSDTSIENPSWRSARRAVVDLLGVCLSKEVNTSIVWQSQIYALLAQISTDTDRLDEGDRILLSHDEPLTEAINSTRGRALEDLIDYGVWVRRNKGADTPIPEIGETLGMRFADKPSLTAPEYALLAAQIVRLFWLDKEWTTKYFACFFPRNKPTEWRASLEALLGYSRPYAPIFPLLKTELEYALTKISDLRVEQKARGRSDLISNLGEHILAYYIWGLSPLTGSTSLLEQFYSKTDETNWAHLFDHVGRSINNSGPVLEAGIKQRVIQFFDARFLAKNKKELQEFTFWLEAECLDAKWRLEAYSKILDHTDGGEARMMLRVETLNKLLADHSDLVVECFAKLTNVTSQREYFYIQTDEATPILRAGLKSLNPKTRKWAELAKENLLKLGRFEFLDIK